MEAEQKVKILVADDEEVVCEVIKRYLGKRMSAEIVTVDSGEKAVQVARDMKPDLLFLDVTFVGPLSGWQVVAELRKFDQHVRIVMISGQGGIPEQYEAMARQEVAEYLLKPLQIEALYQAALKVLGSTGHQSGEFFLPGNKAGMIAANKLAHDLSNINMTIQMHCEHFLSSRQAGYFKEADAEAVLKDAAESFEVIQRKCLDMDKIIESIRDFEKK